MENWKTGGPRDLNIAPSETASK